MEDNNEEPSNQCPIHPHKNNTPGGICAVCLQEKLGKLVSSSQNAAVFPSSSSSPSPSFRSETHDYNKKAFLNAVVFNRSKSVANHKFSDVFAPNKRGFRFWSFLYSRKTDKVNFQNICEEIPDRKVSRSRSVGCGSRSFSGDFFDRISTGFGDCTLRRVESQREGKSKLAGGQACIKERVKCGGLFARRQITSSSSCSSSSTEDHLNGKRVLAGNLAHGRSKSWGWALTSPIRAFSKPSGKNKNITPNLAAIPSLLSVGR